MLLYTPLLFILTGCGTAPRTWEEKLKDVVPGGYHSALDSNLFVKPLVPVTSDVNVSDAVREHILYTLVPQFIQNLSDPLMSVERHSHKGVDVVQIGLFSRVNQTSVMFHSATALLCTINQIAKFACDATEAMLQVPVRAMEPNQFRRAQTPIIGDVVIAEIQPDERLVGLRIYFGEATETNLLTSDVYYAISAIAVEPQANT